MHGDRMHLGRQVLQFTDERETSEPEAEGVGRHHVLRAQQAAPAAGAGRRRPPLRSPRPRRRRPQPAASRRRRRRRTAGSAAAAAAAAAATAPAPPAAPAPPHRRRPRRPRPLRRRQPAVMFQASIGRFPAPRARRFSRRPRQRVSRSDADCHTGVCGMDPVKVIVRWGAPRARWARPRRATLEDFCGLGPGASSPRVHGTRERRRSSSTSSSSDALKLAQGLLVAGRYELVECLGTGAMGEVWRARDTRFESRLVAVKFLREDETLKEDALNRDRMVIRLEQQASRGGINVAVRRSRRLPRRWPSATSRG